MNQWNCPLLEVIPGPGSEAPIPPLVVTAIKNAALKPFNKKWISPRRGLKGWSRTEEERMVTARNSV